MKPPQPSDLFGPLFAAVQESGLFADSKTFADAVPKRAAAEILGEWERSRPPDAAALREFVLDNFDVPPLDELATPDALPLADHIAALWPLLTREAQQAEPDSSLLPLPRRHVVPGGRFRELYYWDSYFTMLGLARSGRQDLVEDMIANFGHLIDRYGHIPNGTRSYYLSRSQPPVFYLMAAMSEDRSAASRRQRLGWMRAEHAFWMEGEAGLDIGGAHRRVVRLESGALLNRYWDDRAAPRDESWREDLELARRTPMRPPGELWRDIRAAAESGWDFSSRWLGDGQTLETIRTTRLLPIDLNALMFGLEQAIASEAAALDQTAISEEYALRAELRAEAIDRFLWNASTHCYGDYDLDASETRDELTGAAAWPLFTGLASSERARSTAKALARLLRPGGLLATEVRTGQQWDAPNGWAPLQWVAVEGLRRYSRQDLANTITCNWLAMIEQEFAATGKLLEKYDVEQCGAGGGGEYGTEIGFGWTNGVSLAMLATSPDHSPPNAALA